MRKRLAIPHLIERARRRPLLTAVLFLLGLLFLEFPGLVLMRQVPFVCEMGNGSDLFNLAYPYRQILSDAVRQGQFPLWTDRVAAGFPIHSVGEGGFLYPPNLLLSLLPLAASVNLSFLLIYLGGGLFTFLYARQLGMSLAAALLSAMAFVFSGFLFGHIRHVNLIAAAHWLPLLLFLCERYARTRRAGHLLALAPVQALQHLAGNPQMTYYSVLFAGCYLAARLLWQPRDSVPSAHSADAQSARRTALRRTVRGLAAYMGIALLGAGLAGGQLLPSMEFQQSVHRVVTSSYEEASRITYPARHLVTLIRPAAFGDPGRGTYAFSAGTKTTIFWENAGYVGIVPLLLALLAVVLLGRRRRIVVWFAACAVLSLLLVLGDQTPLYGFLWHHLPGMSLFRVPARFLLITDLCLAVLAGFGLDALRARLAYRHPARAGVLAAGLILLAAMDLLPNAARYYTLVDARRWLAAPPVSAALRESGEEYRVFSTGCEPSWEQAVTGNGGWHRNPDALLPLRNNLQPLSNAQYGVSHLGVYRWGLVYGPTGNLVDVTQARLASPLPEERERALSLLSRLNVRYLVANAGMASPRLSPVATYPVAGAPEAPICLYRLRDTLPRAFATCRARVVPNLEEAASLLVEGEDEGTVLLNTNQLPEYGFQASGESAGPLPVRWLEHGAQRLLLEVDLPADGWLVLSDTYYSGWVATVDGEPTPLLRANVMGRAVAVPAGKHQVAFTLVPEMFHRGLALGGVSLLILLMLAARTGAPGRRKPGHH